MFFLNLEDGYFGCQVNESTEVLQLLELSKLCDNHVDCYQGTDEQRDRLKCTGKPTSSFAEIGGGKNPFPLFPLSNKKKRMETLPLPLPLPSPFVLLLDHARQASPILTGKTASAVAASSRQLRGGELANNSRFSAD